MFVRLFVVVLVGVVLYVGIMRSRWFDKKAKEIVNPPNFDEAETDVVIDKIESTKTALDDRAKERKDQATALKEEAEKIDGYLHKEKVTTDEVKKEEKPME